MPRKLTVLFFANVKSRSELYYVDFYAQDIKILSDLGFEVQIATKFREIRSADLFFVWWWTWAFFPVSIARLLKVPVMITGTFNFWSFDSRPFWQRKLIEYSLRNASANITVSKLEHAKLKEAYPAAQWFYSPHIVDTTLFSPGGQREKRFVYTTASMTPGNAERKCIPEILLAAPIVRSRFPDVKFLLGGNIHYSYGDMATRTGVSQYVNFLGIIRLEDKIRYLKTCAVYLQPTRFEGFGLAILEALSCGAPVVTSRVGAVPEVVDEAAEYVDGSSPESIARGVIRLLESAELRQALGAKGRERAVRLFNVQRRKRDIANYIDLVMTGSH